MSFFAILLALLLEQARPLGRHNAVSATVRAWAYGVGRNVDAGKPAHAWLAWGLMVLVPALLSLAVHVLLQSWLGWPVAMLWSVLVLYSTLGFRQFSHHFTGIRDALEAGDEESARTLLAQWQRVDASALPRSEIVRHVIEYSVLAAHRHVFGVLAWYSVLAAFGLGPAGAVFYRLAEFAARHWSQTRCQRTHPPSPALQQVASRVWALVDWLPARLTALSFAVVGSFEDAIDGWRNYAERFPNDNDGVVLAATAGAMNVRLGGAALKTASARANAVDTLADAVDPGASGASTPGRAPEQAHLVQVVGLVWRSVVVWMVLLALLTLARLLG